MWETTALCINITLGLTSMDRKSTQSHIDDALLLAELDLINGEFDSLTNLEISRRTGIKPRTVDKIVEKALKKLKSSPEAYSAIMQLRRVNSQ